MADVPERGTSRRDPELELVGTAAGETAEPKKIMPRAVNTVVFRIAVFYVGSVLLLSLLLPYTSYSADESPFVTFFSHIGSPQSGAVSASIMNFVVLTAAMSSLNAGLYSTGRILRSMAVNGSAPRFTMRMSSHGVPYGGILLTACITLLGVVLNAVVPSQAFEIVLEVSALGIVGGWATIILCQMKLHRMADQGLLQRPAFRLFGAPFTAWLTLAFLLFVLVTMGFSVTGRWVLLSLVVIVPLLVLGWFAFRTRIREAALAREGHTGTFPVLAERPAIDHPPALFRRGTGESAAPRGPGGAGGDAPRDAPSHHTSRGDAPGAGPDDRPSSSDG